MKEETNQLVITKQFEAPLKLVKEEKAKEIQKTFYPMIDALDAYEERFNKIIDKSADGINSDLIKDAKRLRLDLVKVRTGTGKLKDELKAEVKRYDKAVMGVHNIIVYAVSSKEKKLQNIENYFEELEKKRLEALQRERADLLSDFVDDAYERDLASLDDDVWEALYTQKQIAHQEKLKAEEEARRQREEQERLLKLERERREKALPYKRFWPQEEIDFGSMSIQDFNKFIDDLMDREEGEKRIQKLRELYVKRRAELRSYNYELPEGQILSMETTEREFKGMLSEAKRLQEIRETEERRIKEKLQKQLREKEEKEEKERKEKEKLQKQLREKEEREERERREREKEERERRERKEKELQMKDSDRFNALILDLQSLKSKYTFKSAKNKQMYEQVGILIDKIIGHINK